MILETGDIFFTRGHNYISNFIRIGETLSDKEKAVINHTGVIVTGGELSEAIGVEALVHVMKHPIYDQYHNTKNEIAIFRPIGLTLQDKDIIIDKANDYVGRDYGYLKIVTHAMDACIGGHYFFRRLTHEDKYPICSWVTGFTMAKVGRYFGVDPAAANPDDIWDYCLANTDSYQQVLSLTRI